MQSWSQFNKSNPQVQSRLPGASLLKSSPNSKVSVLITSTALFTESFSVESLIKNSLNISF